MFLSVFSPGSVCKDGLWNDISKKGSPTGTENERNGGVIGVTSSWVMLVVVRRQPNVCVSYIDIPLNIEYPTPLLSMLLISPFSLPVTAGSQEVTLA